MMNGLPRSVVFLLALASMMTGKVQAQVHTCGHHHLCMEDPTYHAEIMDWQKLLQRLPADAARVVDVISIPVTVHVIHSGEAQGTGRNISDEQIRAQIRILNEDFRRLNTDQSRTPAGFSNVAADTEIEFCLAVKDPSGNATTGITRHRYNSIPNTSYIENTIKPATYWDPNRYLNIWVLDMPNNNILGYSFLPVNSTVGAIKDGLVINYEHFGFFNANNRGRTTTHEMGHYLGLLHIWGEDDANGNPIGCTSDDGVADTPNQEKPYFGCPGFPQNSCSSEDMFMNYMDYTGDNCMNLFTQGQKAVMRNTLRNIRSQLVSHAATACNLNVSCNAISQQRFETGFEAGLETSWKIINNNQDTETWSISVTKNTDFGPATGSRFARYQWNQDNVTPADDYLFTPCFSVNTGHKYRIRFAYACAEDKANRIVYQERLRVGTSSLQSPVDFVLLPNGDLNPVANAYPTYQVAALEYIAANSNPVAIGFHAASPANRYTLLLDDLIVEDLGPVVHVNESNQAIGASIYPNPASGTLNLQLPFLKTAARCTLFSLTGQVVYQAPVHQTLSNIDVHQLPVGLYMLEIEFPDGIWRTSVAIQH